LRRAVYPGSFDPITFGHVDLIKRAAQLFDEVLVAVADNIGKEPTFSPDERRQLAEASLSKIKNVKVIAFRGLLADLVEREQCCAIIRGLRAVSDFEYEFQMGLMNRKLSQRAETVFLLPSLRWVYISSSLIKEIASHQGNVDDLVPEVVRNRLVEHFRSRT
jgi:pantetheine-phosphate adenylyltransferase